MIKIIGWLTRTTLTAGEDHVPMGAHRRAVACEALRPVGGVTIHADAISEDLHLLSVKGWWPRESQAAIRRLTLGRRAAGVHLEGAHRVKVARARALLHRRGVIGEQRREGGGGLATHTTGGPHGAHVGLGSLKGRVRLDAEQI